MLMITRKMTFVDGKVTLYGQDVLIFPPQSITAYLSKAYDDLGSLKTLYLISKKSMLEYKQNLKAEFAQSTDKNWICNTINLYGYGNVKYEDANTIPTGTLILEDSFLIKEFENTKYRNIDHLLRGIIAGLISAITDRDFDAIEVEYQANSNNVCKIVIDGNKNLKERFPSLYEEQL